MDDIWAQPEGGGTSTLMRNAPGSSPKSWIEKLFSGGGSSKVGTGPGRVSNLFGNNRNRD